MRTRIVIAAAFALAACSSDKPIDYTVVLVPASATVTAGKTLQLGAASKGEIAWSVQEPNGGAVSATGTYTAPSTPGTYHVVATSAKDAKKSATATITVVAPPQTPSIGTGRLLTAGKTGAASVAPQDGMAFKWVIFGGSIAGPDNATSVSFTSSDPGEVVLGCTVSNAAGDAAPEAVAVVTVIPPATTPAISAPAVLTTGRAGMVASVPAQPGVTLKWTIGNGALTSGDTAASIVFTAGTPGTLALSVVATNAAGDSAPAANASVEIRPTGLELLAGGLGGPGNLDGKGAAARFSDPRGLAIDSAGNAFVADTNNSTIRKIAPDGTVTTFAGQDGVFNWADGVGTAAIFWNPSGLAMGPGDLLYVADLSNNRVRAITPGGAVSTVSGNGTGAELNGEGAGAEHNGPWGIAAAANGEVWVFDYYGAALRKIAPNPDGGPRIVTTPSSGSLCCSTGITLDSEGSVYVGEGYQYNVDKFDGGSIWPAAGLRNNPGYVDGPGTTARLGAVGGIAFDPATSAIFLGDETNSLIRRMDYDASSGEWVVGTAAGAYGDAGSNDGTLGAARVGYVSAIAPLGNGDLLFADETHYTIRKLSGGAITTVAGRATPEAVRVEGPAASARFQSPQAVAVGPDDSTYVADAEYIRRISPGGVVSTFAGSGVAANQGAVDGLAGSASFSSPTSLAFDKPGHVLYVVDQGFGTIRAVTYEPAFGADVVTTVAGSVNMGCTGVDSDNAIDAGLCNPQAVAVDSKGRVFFSEVTYPTRLRMLERFPDGGGFTLTTVATGAGCLGRPQPAFVTPPGAAQGNFCEVDGLAVDSKDRLFYADRSYSMVGELEFDGGFWVINDVAGVHSCASNDGEGLDAGFCAPTALAFDRHDTLWVGDNENHSVRKMTFNPASQAWKVDTVAGLPASHGVRLGPLPASLNAPWGMAVTPFGDLALVDQAELSILLLRPEEPAAPPPALVQRR